MESGEIVRPSGSVSATGPRGRVRVDRFAARRVCVFDGCPTVLSFYNPADRCWMHTEPRPKISLGRRPQEPDGPRVLSESEEQGLIRSLLRSKEGRVGPRG
jgi:hypothetical protein